MNSRSIRAIVYFGGKSHNMIEVIFEEVGNTSKDIACMESIETEIMRLDKFIDLKSRIPQKEYKIYSLLYSGYTRYNIKENNNFILDATGKSSEISNEQLPVGGYPVRIFGMKEMTVNRMRSDIMNVYFIDRRMDKI